MLVNPPDAGPAGGVAGRARSYTGAMLRGSEPAKGDFADKVRSYRRYRTESCPLARPLRRERELSVPADASDCSCYEQSPLPLGEG